MEEAGIAIVLMLVILVIYLCLFGLGIANYIMTSLSFYTIARRRQIANPWMAWLPFANDWLVGSITDDYDAQNGIKRKWRVVLLTMSIIFSAGFIIAYIAIFVIVFLNLSLADAYSAPDEIAVLGSFLSIYICFIAICVVGVVYQYCRVICVYKIFESTVPEKSVKYLILSLLVPLAQAVCLMRCKDKGYSKLPDYLQFSPIITEPVSEEDSFESE